MSEHASIAAKTRQGRQGRRAERAKPAIGPAYITRRIPSYELLSEEGLARFDLHADLILEEIGMEIRGDEVALRLFKDAGIPVPEHVIATVDDVRRGDVMKRPYVVKPLNEGSSVGVVLSLRSMSRMTRSTGIGSSPRAARA